MGDPVTGPLSVVLGIPQLVFAVVQYYEIFLSYVNQKKEFSGIYVLFLVQHQQFDFWKSRAMPDGKTLLTDDAAKELLTRACLSQIRAAFEDAQKLSQRFGKQTFLNWFVRRQELNTTIQDVSKVRKLIWALEGSKSAEKLLSLLERYNKALQLVWNFSPESFQRQFLPELDDFNSISGLRLIEDALKREDSEEYRSLLSSVITRRAHLEEKDAAKHGLESIGGRIGNELELHVQDFKYPEAFSEEQAPRIMTTADGDEVLLEWKRYKEPDEISDRKRHDRAATLGISGLARNLAKPVKPWKLKTLDCVGYLQFADAGRYLRFAVVFRIPQDAQPEPITLRQLIKQDREDVCQRPFSLGDRFLLAQGLTKAVYSLLSVGWLHKGIRSRSVQFFRPKDAPQDWQAISKQFVLMGFESSRPISVAMLSEKSGGAEAEDDYYLDPEYLQDCMIGYQPQFDLYSLGIVLTEIALWKPIEVLLERLSVLRNSRRIHRREFITEYIVPELELAVGVVYADAVRRCVNGNFDVENGEKERELLKSFDKLVIANLDKCYA